MLLVARKVFVGFNGPTNSTMGSACYSSRTAAVTRMRNSGRVRFAIYRCPFFASVARSSFTCMAWLMSATSWIMTDVIKIYTWIWRKIAVTNRVIQAKVGKRGTSKRRIDISTLRIERAHAALGQQRSVYRIVAFSQTARRAAKLGAWPVNKHWTNKQLLNTWQHDGSEHVRTLSAACLWIGTY